MTKKKEQIDLSVEAGLARNARSKFKQVADPSKAQKAAFDALETAMNDAAAELKAKREAFLATVKGA